MTAVGPEDPSLRRAALALRLGVAGSALAAAWLSWTQYSELNSWLYMRLGVAEGTAFWIDRGCALGLTLAALAALSGRGTALLSFVALWFAATSVASLVLRGRPLPELAPLAHAVRFTAPLALMALVSGRGSLAEGLLRWAAAATFVAHGVEALAQVPEFVDLILLSAFRYGLDLSEAQARWVLTAIGILDLAVAAGIVLRRWRTVAGYMAVWGSLTLASRTTASGLEALPESALRLSNAAVPCALLLLWSRRGRVDEVSP